MTEAEHRAWWAERTDVAYGLCWCGCGEATSISTRTDRANGYARGRPFAYVRGHATALKRRTKVETLPEPNPSGLCMCGCGQKTSLAKQTKTQAGWVHGKPLPFLPNHFLRKLTKEQEAEACRRYVEGETCNEIGASFGVSRKTVTRVLECHGVSIRPKSTPRPDLRLLSLDEETEICQRYKAGESSDALGKAFGVSGITVRKALERNGVQRRPSIAGPPLTAEQRAEICRRYVEGEHHKAIAAAFDIEPGTVYRVLKREGVSPRIVPYTEEQRDEVCRRYLAGDEIRAICKATGMNTSGLYAVLRDNHIERDRTVWATEAEEAEICRRYAEGESGPVLARDFGVTDGAILGVLQSHGVPRRSGSEALRRYSCDHSFFDEIDTEAKAYWLGFIAADGCVTDKNVLSISLSSRDHDHLLRFKADLQASHPVASYMATTKPPGSREARTASVSSISIASPQLAETLAGQGIVPRKTFVLRWPERLPPELLRHFLRGYSDGDGCFHVSLSSYVRKRDGERAAHLNWSIIGTEPLCNGARRYLG